MLRFLARKPCIGIEITGSAVRVAVVSGRGANLVAPYTKCMDLPAGVVSEVYASPNILDFERVAAVLSECIAEAPSDVRRAALSLPDSVFRVQTLEFDELPGKAEDRERLIRWRLEKGASFDIADTVLRYQVLGQQESGFTVLSCVAKHDVIAQYESLLLALGLEPWAVGPSTFYTQNFYTPYLAEKSDVSALAHVTEDSFATIIRETSGTSFYRYKDVKRGGTGDVLNRLIREIDDSLHFYTHMDRSQLSEVRDLYLTGESRMSDELAAGLRKTTSLNIEVLAPILVIASFADIEPELAAALGAGCSL
jgi:Tfp pilus assembly PilM family ATPase